MKNHIPATVAVVLSMLGPISCKNAPEEKHTSFETLTLAPTDLKIPYDFSAAITGRNDVSIMPQTNGQLMNVCVAPGQKVKKGDKLFVIDSRKAKQMLTATEADLAAAESQCSSALLEYESNKNLFEKKIVSEYMLNTSRNDYNRALAAVEQAKAAVANAQLNLEFCTITSPVEGVVGDIDNNPGDQVSEMTLLTVISGNSEMKASFSIAETLFKDLVEETGSLESLIASLPEVSLILKDGTEYPYNGKIRNISGVVDRVTGSLTLEAFFPNPDGFLFSGIQGTIRITSSYEDILVAPLSSLVRVQDKAFVYKVNDNCAESTVVEFAEIGNGKDVALLGGVNTGDVIVAKGAANVYEGQQVIFPEESEKSK
ncbi:MAG: efflux RND transporter periplasmic adaptor subunit [Bacteroidales bacterium]|nr:efflux RND transporter periplasmic adaptor subunit [Bacteroidales bacterium]